MLVNWDMNDSELIDWIEGILDQCEYCALDDETDKQQVALKLAANFIHALRMRAAHPSDRVGEAV